MKTVGFTGSEQGMTASQTLTVGNLLARPDYRGGQFHHGDCIGADAQAAEIARGLGYVIHCHPPANESKRAWNAYHVIYPTKPYLNRNHDIVDAIEVLIATPRANREELRSGTWATVRYARRTGKRLFIVYPDGELG